MDLTEPILADMGFELVDLEYLMERGRWILRLYIDTEKGVTLDDCARVSRELGDVMDVHDVIEHRYVLEISSPGLDRPLRREKDFIRVIGKRIKVRMVAPIQGRRNFTGYLVDFQEGNLFMETNGEKVSLPRSDVEKANLVYEFEA
ncbi:MAG: ribosome maturation factor RimP [Desulfobacteraceae bacterium]|nr:MAG: ribosome maturation factor RimP [Desulfobacteraceae bacterium]